MKNKIITVLIAVLTIVSVLTMDLAMGVGFNDGSVSYGYDRSAEGKKESPSRGTLNFAKIVQNILQNNGWVCLLKIRAAAKSGGQQTLEVVEKYLGREKTESLLTQEDKAVVGKKTTENVRLEDLSTESLSECFNALQEYACLEESEEALDTATRIGYILDARFLDLDPEEQKHRMSEPITKELLVSFVTMYIDDIKASLSHDMQGLYYTTASEGEEMLKTLTAFLSEVEKNAADENVYDYWCKYWEDIRGESLPIYYYKVK